MKVLRARREYERLREVLLHRAAHQLRGPLSVITGMTSILRANETGRTREGLDTIAIESARLTRMLENLFAVSRFAPDATLRREWMPIDDVIGTALGRLETELGDRPIKVSVAPGTLAHVDPILLELMLVNLVDNANRHTPAGSVIEIVARREAVVAIIEISDRGPGLARGVFEQPLEQARGLGLGVCRGIADVHGGAVVSFARDGGGTVFLITLPDAEPLPEEIT